VHMKSLKIHHVNHSMWQLGQDSPHCHRPPLGQLAGHPLPFFIFFFLFQFLPCLIYFKLKIFRFYIFILLICLHIFLLRVTHVIILLVMTWHTNEIRQVFWLNLNAETKLLFWYTPRTSELFFIQQKAVGNLGQSHELILHLSQ
jgi:hypothetical protein